MSRPVSGVSYERGWAERGVKEHRRAWLGPVRKLGGEVLKTNTGGNNNSDFELIEFLPHPR